MLSFSLVTMLYKEVVKFISPIDQPLPILSSTGAQGSGNHYSALQF